MNDGMRERVICMVYVIVFDMICVDVVVMMQTCYIHECMCVCVY